MEKANSVQPTRFVIFLVHGTFARNASWTSPDSKLVRRLRAELPGEVEIFPFPWSGRNKLSDRMYAARALAESLSQSCQDDLEASHYVIAHSHGGNIALWAANSPIRAIIKGIACLSTPFLHIESRRQSGLFGFSAWYLFALVFVWWYDRKYNLSILALVSWIGVLTLIGSLIILMIWFLLDRTIKSEQLNMVFPQEFQDRVLVLRTAGDEASQVLVAAQFGNWIVDRVSSVFGAAIRGLGLVIPYIEWGYDRSYKRVRKIFYAILLFAGETAIFESLRRLWWMKHYIGSGTHQAIAAFILIYAVVFVGVAIGGKESTSFFKLLLDIFARGAEGIARFASSVFLLPFGSDAAIFSWFFRIHAEPSPPGMSEVKYVAAEDFSESWLSPRHALYDNGEAIEEIVRWIKAREQAGAVDLPKELIQYVKQRGLWPETDNNPRNEGLR